MRRRRQRLQVSTFPFLAVLLCAMGSLILLLLVLDRRARVVARVRGEHAALSAVAEDEKLTAAREAEWERRRQALHALLTQQVEEARKEAEAIHQKQANAAAEFETAHSGLRGLEAEVDAERGRLTHMENAIATRHASAADHDKQTAATRAELDRMARDLNSLELALADLKALRQRQQQTYSVVPYRGKHGDNRNPLYVECTAGCISFHPDRQRLFVSQIIPSAIHAEVERRLAQRVSDPGTGTKPYLLLLVRPDGVLTYTRLQIVLRQLNLDFGYEFIEQDWALDFPKDDQGPGSQSWMNAGPVIDKSETRPGTSPGGNPRRPFRIVGEANPNHNNSGGSGGGPAGIGPITAVPGGSARGSLAGSGSSSPSDPANLLGSPKVAVGSPVAGVSDGRAGSPTQAQPDLGHPVGIGSNGGGGAPVSPLGAGAPGFTGQPAPEASAGFAAAPAGSAGGSGSSEQPGPAPSGHAETPGGGSTPAVVVGAPQDARARGTPDTGDVAGLATANRGGAAGLLSNSPIAAAEKPGGKASQSGDQKSPGNEQTGSVNRLLSGPPSEDKPVKTIRKTNDPQRRWIGSRDWIISIECVKGAVIVRPGGQTISAADFSRGAGPDNPLQQAARKLIDRRQATVIPGDLPYRPQIRFLVRPDGLHSYYLAYPVLEPLHVPMTRQNLEEEQTGNQ